MAGYKTVNQMRAHQQVMAREGQQHLDQFCRDNGFSSIFKSKFKGKCNGCEGTGIITQGAECVMFEGKIFHFDCAARFVQRRQPCETCGATGELRQSGPVSDKQVCCECATGELRQQMGL
jgi:hypothetical protein